jgi:hypothetical protein
VASGFATEEDITKVSASHGRAHVVAEAVRIRHAGTVLPSPRVSA